MKITILNQKWTCVSYRLKTYNRRCGSDSVALCETDIRKISFLKDGLTIETVIHELVHAYAAELSFAELDLDEDQAEEFWCELFARQGIHILTLASEIFNELK